MQLRSKTGQYADRCANRKDSTGDDFVVLQERIRKKSTLPGKLRPVQIRRQEWPGSGKALGNINSPQGTKKIDKAYGCR
jgi:hypothetical protein